MSGSNSQFVIEICLDDNALDPRVDIHRQTLDLLPGKMVRVYVGNARAVMFAIPFISPFDFDWYRRDLVWQFIGSNKERLLEWQLVVTELEAVK